MKNSVQSNFLPKVFSASSSVGKDKNGIMRFFHRMVCLVVFLLSISSGVSLQAQQYEVEVELSGWTCTEDIIGTISIGPTSVGPPSTTGAMASMTNSFTAASSVTSEIFSGIFDYVPTQLTFNVNGLIAPVELGEGEEEIPVSGCEGVAYSVSLDLSSNGSLSLYTLTSQDQSQTITLAVRIIQTGLMPGVIGSNQTICELQTPDPITGTDATGATDISYRWEYASSNPGTWLPVLTELGDPTSIVTTETYTPSRPEVDTWYRRVAINNESGAEAPSNAVIITLAMALEERHVLKITIEEYKCNGTSFSPFLDLVANIDGSGFEGYGTPSNGALVVPTIFHEFTERPQQISLNVVQIFGGDESISCSGPLSGFIDLDLQTTDQEYYTIRPAGTIPGVGQELTVLVEINSTGQSMINGGVIGDDQTLCFTGETANDLNEVTAPIGATAQDRYGWEISTDNGVSWETVVSQTNEPITTTDLPLGVINEESWYRRVIARDCSIGYSNVVKVTFEALQLASISGLVGPYRVGDAPVEIVGTPSGGTFSVNGEPIIADASGKYFFSPAAFLGGRYTVQYSFTSAAGCTSIALREVVIEAEALCSSIVPLSGSGEFKIDNFSGRIIYRKTTDDCENDIPISCISTESAPPVISGVIQASATSMSDEWDYTPYYLSRFETTKSGADDFETGILGKWRGKDSYVYNTSELVRDKNYNTGTFDMSLFNWRYDDVNQKDRWINASSVLKYSPNGEALEEVNAIGISSAVKMGYHDNVPYLTAQNATYESVFFESFEVDYNGNLESGARVSTAAVLGSSTAHAGSRSLMLPSFKGLTTPTMNVSNNATAMMVQIWVKGGDDEEVEARLINDNNQVVLTSVMNQVARSGDWGLYQTLLDPTDNTSFKISIGNKGTENLYLDDIRIQPIDAEITCYVYDPATLRLLTIFDSQHFGLYYQYDGEGKLVRKTIETERGTRTLQETFYNIPKVDREHD